MTLKPTDATAIAHIRHKTTFTNGGNPRATIPGSGEPPAQAPFDVIAAHAQAMILAKYVDARKAPETTLPQTGVF
jgi:hypothetical protein